MEELVEVVNQLQDVFSSGVISSAEIDLPQIVVVGTQSAGKSSVLEHIVGKSFLPRGAGIVTRCPLVLQLVKAPDGTEEYATFQHDDKRYTNYDLIRQEIEDQTKRLAGENKGICFNSICLKMFSPSLLNLTLVDLPGLTKVPVGDQPKDIEKQIRDLTLEYIKNPNSIILAVTAANTDMATSDSLQIAKKVDPKGKRTLAVLTKLDLMDEGTDARDMLSGNVIPVKLGIIGVVNRSQKDINDDKSVKASLDDETNFFQTNYKSIAVKHGSPYLTKTVQDILIKHIQECMPDLRERISKMLTAKETNLSQYLKRDLDSPSLLLNLIFKFTNIYVSSIKGSKTNIQTDYLNGGSMIHSKFQDVFAREVRSINPLTGLQTTDFNTAIKNAYGMNPAIFVPEDAFEPLVKRQVEQFRNPSLKCVELVHGVLNNITQRCLQDKSLQLNHYPKLKPVLEKVVREMLQSRLPITYRSVESLIDIQIAHINTSHPDLKWSRDLQTVNLYTKAKKILSSSNTNQIMQLCMDIHCSSQQVEGNAEQNTFYCNLLTMWIEMYISNVCKIIEDTVPKMIVHVLVNFVIEQLQVELVKQIYDKADVDSLLAEPSTTAMKRKELEEEIAVLVKANSIINKLSSPMIESGKVLRKRS